MIFLGKQPIVDVTVDREPGTDVEGVPASIERHPTRETGQDVIVKARFVDVAHVG